MRRRSLSLCAILFLSLASCDDHATLTHPDLAKAGLQGAGGVPARVDPWQDVGSREMWQYASRGGALITLGVKSPGAPRGIFRGRWLVSTPSWQGAVEAVRHHPGIQVLQVDETAPAILLKAESPDALESLRRLPFVDYVEPAVLSAVQDVQPGAPASILAPRFSSGSSGDPNYGYYVDAGGNWIPNIFTGMRIPEAWRLSTGAGVKIGLLDTGVDLGQPDLTHWARYKVYHPDDLDDLKGHGTHMAGVIGARPGRGYVVGVAHGANHLSVKHSNNYLDVNTWRVNAAMDTAVAYGAKVLNMSFRADNTSNVVGDRIEKYYNGLNGAGVPFDVLFVAASGSGGNAGDYLFSVVFPANHPDVIAVSAINYDNLQIYTKSHTGPQVEVSAFHGQPSTGTNDEGYYNGESGNTSNASAIVSGVATLVRARYPSMRNYEVRTRLRRGARDLGLLGRDSYYGYGIVNAYAAVGGFYQSTLLGTRWHDECTATTDPNRTCLVTYTSTACFTETFRVVAHGDGPFTYRWSNGSTSDRTTMTLCPSQDYDYTAQVQVTDGLQNRSLTTTLYIRVDGGGASGCDPNLDPRCPG